MTQPIHTYILEQRQGRLIPRRVILFPLRSALAVLSILLCAALLLTSLSQQLCRLFSPETLHSLALSPFLVTEGDPAAVSQDNPAVLSPSTPQQPLPILPPSKPSPSSSKPAEEIDPSSPDKVTPSDQLPILTADLSGSVLSLSNSTSYTPDLKALLAKQLPIPPVSPAFIAQTDGALTVSATAFEPVVLILHTHGTEAYSTGDFYQSGDPFRSEDPTENMVAVGKVMTETLLSRGIPTVHCTVLHDQDSYSAAYSNAAATIRSYLEKYPSIRYVFDVHRDSVIRADGTAIRPVTVLEGKAVAQVMSVVGTDEGGANHPLWRDHLSLALKLQAGLAEYQLSRPVNLRKASFNQQYAPGALLLEIGSCANTLEEAKRAGEYTAAALADIILGEESG